MKIEREITIEAPPERVYDLLVDPQRLGDWVTIQDHLVEAPAGDLKEGSELVQCLRLAHRRFNVRWTVSEADPPQRIVWDGHGPLRSRASVVYELEADGEGRTRFRYVNDFHSPGGPLARIADRALQGTSGREADRSLEQLKRLLERSR